MKRRLAVVPFALLSCASVGCGPLTVPGVHRLSPDDQAVFEDMWANMLAPPDRLDRELLLDTVCAYQMFQVGVDRLTMRSEKDVPGGKAVMVVRYDRRDPSADTFAVDLYDRGGTVVRSERYSQAEVFARAPVVSGSVSVRIGPAGTQPETQPADAQPAETPEERAARAADERRAARIIAATQPLTRPGQPTTDPAGAPRP